MIRRVTSTDVDEICKIYNHYVLTTAITFDTQELNSEYMAHKIQTITDGGYPFFVYEKQSRVVGYCYLNVWNSKNAYDSTAELTVYVDRDSVRRGIGRDLIRLMVDVCDRKRFHSIVSCITLPNEPSVKLHERLGFTQVAFFREVGLKFGKWQDVGHWQLIFPSQTNIEESCPCGAHSHCKCK